MPLRITEYGGYQSGRPMTPGIASQPFIQSQTIAVGSSVSTNQLSSATRLILVDSDAGVYLFFGSSLSTANVGSSNGQRIPAGVAPIPFYVNPSMKLFATST